MVGSMTVSVNSTPPVDLYANVTVHQAELLSASDDDHGGIIVDMKEPMDPDVFHAKLRASLSLWRQQVFILIAQLPSEFDLLFNFNDGKVFPRFDYIYDA